MYSLSNWFGRKRHPSGQLSLLCLLGDEADRSLMERLARELGWKILFARNLAEARQVRERAEIHVVLLDRDVVGETWREAIRELAGACTLLVSKVSDAYLWNEVVRNGGYDVLPKALQEREAARAVRLAWSYWMSARRGKARSAKGT